MPSTQNGTARTGNGDDFRKEAEAICRAVRDLEKIGMMGVALRLDGKIVAFALGTQLNYDTILEQIEKASNIPGGPIR